MDPALRRQGLSGGGPAQADQKRGPFRPERLVFAARAARQQSVPCSFRFSDLLLVAGVSLVFAAQGLSATGWQTALAADVLPLLAAALDAGLDAGRLRPLPLSPSGSTGGHLTRVAAAVIISGIVSLCVTLLTGRAGALMPAFALWRRRAARPVRPARRGLRAGRPLASQGASDA